MTRLRGKVHPLEPFSIDRSTKKRGVSDELNPRGLLSATSAASHASRESIRHVLPPRTDSTFEKLLRDARK